MRKTRMGNVVLVIVMVLGLCAVGIGLWINFRPEPLTGDVHADRACEAGTSGLLDADGNVTQAEFMMMDSVQRREWVAGIVEHSQRSEIEAIRDAGESLALSTQVDSSSLLGLRAFTEAYGKYVDACTSHGWTACAAGLVVKGCSEGRRNGE